MKKVILAGVLIAVLAAGFAGCTMDEDKDTTSEPSTVTTTVMESSSDILDPLSTGVSKAVTDVSKGVSSVGEDLSKGASKVGEGVSKALS